jgi:tRNA A-37 threonylcarbamoyl transferase component Bud32
LQLVVLKKASIQAGIATSNITRMTDSSTGESTGAVGPTRSSESKNRKLKEYVPALSDEAMGSLSNLESIDTTSTTTGSSSHLDVHLQSQQQPQPGLTLQSPQACSTLRFEDHYQIMEKIAKGSFGTVFVAKHKQTSEEFAVKVIDRRKLSEREKQGVVREVTILRDCKDVEHIVRLIDFYASPKHFFVVQVYAQGGDLFKRLASSNSYNEKNARDLATKLLEAIQVLHERKIVHRDLKPENLLLQDMIDDTMILIADFGFARYVPKEGLKTRCGSKLYNSPYQKKNGA